MLQDIMLVIALWLVTSAPFIALIIASARCQKMTIEQIEAEIAAGTHHC